MRTVEISPVVTKSKQLGFIPVEYESTLNYDLVNLVTGDGAAGEMIATGGRVLEFCPRIGEIRLKDGEHAQPAVVATMQWAGRKRNGIERFVGTIVGDGYRLDVVKPWFRRKTISLIYGERELVVLSLGRISTQESTDESVLGICASKRAAAVTCAEEVLLPGMIAGALTYAYMFEVLFCEPPG